MLAPQSRGSLTLASKDPTVKPRIQHNYFAESAHLDTMVAGLRIALEIGRQAALSRTPNDRTASGLGLRRRLRAMARAYTQSIYHPVGTCAIGTVVDPELRVRGLDRPAGGGCLGHAERAAWQCQCSDHRGGRAGRRPDPWVSDAAS